MKLIIENLFKKQPSVGETLGVIRLPSKGRGGPFERIKKSLKSYNEYYKNNISVDSCKYLLKKK